MMVIWQVIWMYFSAIYVLKMKTTQNMWQFNNFLYIPLPLPSQSIYHHEKSGRQHLSVLTLYHKTDGFIQFVNKNYSYLWQPSCRLLQLLDLVLVKNFMAKNISVEVRLLLLLQPWLTIWSRWTQFTAWDIAWDLSWYKKGYLLLHSVG